MSEFNFSALNPDQRNRIANVLKTKLREHVNDDANDTVVAIEAGLRQIAELAARPTRVPISDFTMEDFEDEGITMRPLLWTSTGFAEAKALGNTTSPNALTIQDTVKHISDIFKFISLDSEAGERVLITVLLMHVASNLETATSDVTISPQFQRDDDEMLEESDCPHKGMMNHMVFQTSFSANGETKSLKCSVYESELGLVDPLLSQLPKAAIAAVRKAQDLGFQTFRGCISCGITWIFFVYTQNYNDLGETIAMTNAIFIEDFDNPAPFLVILGLLKDWVEHGHDEELNFFTYGPPLTT